MNMTEKLIVEDEKVVKEKVSFKEAVKMFAVGTGYMFMYFGKVSLNVFMWFGKLSIEIGKFSWKIMENMNKPKKVLKASNSGKKKKKSSKNNKKRNK